MRLYSIFFLLLFYVTLLFTAFPAFAYTKEDVIKRDKLYCGVSLNSPGFSQMDKNGMWRGLHVDICRAVAAAVLGDHTKVSFIPLQTTGSYTALLSGKVDILLRYGVGTDWDFTHDTALAVNFAGISFFDETGVLFSKSREQFTQQKTVSFCTTDHETDDAVRSFLGHQQIVAQAIQTENAHIAEKKFLNGDCSLIALPLSRLHALQTMIAGKGTIFQGRSFPETSIFRRKITFGPVVRHGDDGWFDIVRWVLFAMIDAEILGIHSGNINAMRLSTQPAVHDFFGENGSGKSLGLPKEWAVHIIQQVGNYGEIFAKNLGKNSTIHIKRGANSLWIHGGLLYAPPLR